MERPLIEIPMVKQLAKKCANFSSYVKSVSVDVEESFEILPLWPQLIAFAGHGAEAVEFLVSLGIEKTEAEDWVERSLSEMKYSPTCSMAGCEPDQIKKCFPKVSEDRINNISPVKHILHPAKKARFIISKELTAVLSQEHAPSPVFIKSMVELKKYQPSEYQDLVRKLEQAGIDASFTDKSYSVTTVSLEDKGFVLTEGSIVDINETKYARYILNNFDIAVTTGNRFYLYENGVWNFMDVEEKLSRILLNFLHRDAPNFWRMSIEKKYLNALKRLAPYVEFDKDKNYINLENGIYDISQNTLQPHSKEYYTTIRIPIAYSPDAECPKLKKFLNEIFEGDQQLIALIGEIIGYSLTAETQAQKGFMFYGSGSNGKSVLAELIAALAGKENVSSLTLNDFDKSFARSEIIGKTVNISTENEVDGSKFNTQFLKSIIGGDCIRVEAKFEKGFSYKPICKIILCMNSLPHSLDQSHGYFRRLIIVPFNKRISEKDANKNLINELLDELPGIFNFAIEGLARLRANNYIFSKSEAAENALNEYRAELDPLFEFINQKIESAEPNVRTRRKEIKNAYAEFLVHEGYKKVKELSDRRFWKLFREELNRRKINFEEEKINGERCFSGIQFFMERQELTLGEADLDVKTELDDYLDDDSDDYLDDDSDDYLDDDSEEYVVEDSDDEI